MLRWTAGTKARADRASRQHGYTGGSVPTRLLLARRAPAAQPAAIMKTQPRTSAAVGAAPGNTGSVAAVADASTGPDASSRAPHSCTSGAAPYASASAAVALAEAPGSPAALRRAASYASLTTVSSQDSFSREECAARALSRPPPERPSIPPDHPLTPSSPSPPSSPLPTPPRDAAPLRRAEAVTESTATTTATTSMSVLSGHLPRQSRRPPMTWMRQDARHVHHAAPLASSSPSSSTVQAERLVEAAQQRQARKHARRDAPPARHSKQLRGGVWTPSSDADDLDEGEADTYAKIRRLHQQQLLERRGCPAGECHAARRAPAASSSTSAGVPDSRGTPTRGPHHRRRHPAPVQSVDCVSVQLPLRRAPALPATAAAAVPAEPAQPMHGDVPRASLVAHDTCARFDTCQPGAGELQSRVRAAETAAPLDAVAHALEQGYAEQDRPMWVSPWQPYSAGVGGDDCYRGGMAVRGAAVPGRVEPPARVASVFEDRPLSWQECPPGHAHCAAQEEYAGAMRGAGGRPPHAEPWAESTTEVFHAAAGPDCVALGETGNPSAAWGASVAVANGGADAGGPLWPGGSLGPAPGPLFSSRSPPPPLLSCASWQPPTFPCTDMSGLHSVFGGSGVRADTPLMPGLVGAVNDHTADSAGTGWGEWHTNASTQVGWQHSDAPPSSWGALSEAAPESMLVSMPPSPCPWVSLGDGRGAADERDGLGYAFAVQDALPPPAVPWLAGSAYPDPPVHASSSSVLAVSMPQPLYQPAPPEIRSLQGAAFAFPARAVTAPMPTSVGHAGGERAPRQRSRHGPAGARAPRPLNGTTERCRLFWERCRYPGGPKS